jgi:hypothetical protein
MSLFDEKKEGIVQQPLVVLSALALLLTALLNLFGGQPVISPFFRTVIWSIVGICMALILFLIIPRTIRWMQVRIVTMYKRKQQNRVLVQLRDLVSNGLNELFDPNSQHSLRWLIQNLQHRYVGKGCEAESKLRIVTEKFNILSDWSHLLVQTLKKPGVIHDEDRFQSTIQDVMGFHHSLGDVIREINSIDLTCDSNYPRDKETERKVVENHNHYVNRLKDIIKSADKLGTYRPSPSFTPLELK